MKEKNIFIVEDEEDIRDLFSLILKKDYNLHFAFDGKEALEFLKTNTPDLILLDLMIPLIDGSQVCKEIQKDTKLASIPLIIISAKTQENDQIEGLAIGADDYITKPFSPNILKAKIKSLLRRFDKNNQVPDIITCGKLSINTSSYKVYYNNKEISLTNIEYKILLLLANNANNVFSRKKIIEGIRQDNIAITLRTIDVHILSLRKKINDLDFIQTIRGVGYKITID